MGSLPPLRWPISSCTTSTKRRSAVHGHLPREDHGPRPFDAARPSSATRRRSAAFRKQSSRWLDQESFSLGVEGVPPGSRRQYAAPTAHVAPPAFILRRERVEMDKGIVQAG